MDHGRRGAVTGARRHVFAQGSGRGVMLRRCAAFLVLALIAVACASGARDTAGSGATP